MSILAEKSAPIRWATIAVIVAALFVLTRVLPFDRGLELVSDWVADLGWIGPLAFGLIYIVASLLFVPGSVLTLAAGAVFGLVLGTITVAIAATSTAAAAFLIARYGLRSRIESIAKKSRRFGAIDTAISEGGWKIVGLLRLSPAVPFSIVNYLFGLTRVRFLAYVATSFVAMLPGTFMYVYLGYVGRASAAGDGRTTAEWVLLGVGLVATVAVTIYITKLAKQALAKKTAIESDGDEPEAGTENDKRARAATDVGSESASGTRGTVVLIGAAALAVALAAVGFVKKEAISSLLGPPRVSLEEKFDKREGEVFSHAGFDAILSAHVDADGWVDYAAIANKRAELGAYLETLAAADLEPLSRDERLAFYINAYNAYTLALILDHRPLASIKDIPSEERWDAARWNIAGKDYSLSQIEHELIRGQFKEPRVHFAINCASVGCPPLRNEAFTGAALEAQLADQTAYVHSRDRWVSFDPATGKLELTRLYQWYKSDFEQVAGSVLDYAASYVPELAKARASGRKIDRRWLAYDWSLNGMRSGSAVEDSDAVDSAGETPSPDPVAAQTPAAAVVKKKQQIAQPVKEPSSPKKAPAPAVKTKPTSGGEGGGSGGGGGGGGAASSGGGSSGAPIPRGFR